ncbi:MAG: insulinase family protein [Bacteroidales bacterium]|nr:insulinase family protein [Bacteroidales bacterium]
MKYFSLTKWSVLVCTLFSAFALTAKEDLSLPLDTNVRVGRLDNGLTYYIRCNKFQTNRADFHIAQKVGSMQEEEAQRGLAHFLEHMAFNGTKNFPGNQMKDYLEKIGVKFGTDLNAYTSLDQTVYRVSNVPLIREGIIDSALLILHDWSGFISLEDKEIDKERGVIREEWRTRSDAQGRILDKALPLLYPDCKYGQRFPIGLIDVINNFKYDELRSYYNKWYFPDNQGIIVVGDVNVDQIENKIKKLFSDIPKRENAAERVSVPVPDNKTPIVAYTIDKEATDVSITLFQKTEPFPEKEKNSSRYYLLSYVNNMIQIMLNERFTELLQKSNPPFINAGFYHSSYFISKTKDAWTLSVSCKENGIGTAVKVAVEETERARQFGFTSSEYNRATANFLRGLETQYKERGSRMNDSYVGELINLFLDNEPAPGIEFEYGFWKEVSKQISMKDINDYFKSQFMGDSNMVVWLTGPEKEGLVYPSQQELLSTIHDARNGQLTPYSDNVKNEPLIPNLPKKGSVVKKKVNKAYNTTEWKLSNGIKVVFYPTKLKEDQILMSAFSPGGSSLLPNGEESNIRVMGNVAMMGGYGNFSIVELNKLLAGKNVGLNTSVSSYNEWISGSCSPQDFESMVQLSYLGVTAPRKDMEVYDSFISRTRDALKNQDADPQAALSDTLIKVMYNNHPRSMRFKAEMLDQVNYDRILQMYKERFANCSDFTFVFVGNIQPDSVQGLIEQYIATLPGTGKTEKPKDLKMKPFKGEITNHFKKKLETSKSSVNIAMNGKCPYSLESKLQLSVLTQILRILFTEKIREKEGGTYGVSVGSSISNYPRKEFSMMIQFDTDPALQEKLVGIIYNELDSICLAGPREEDLQKVKEYMIKQYDESCRQNSYWKDCIVALYQDNIDLNKGYRDIVSKMTVSSIRKFAASLFKQGNRAEVVMGPQ